jgi:EAL and modified HD-GYP domain-containing signal transduction protein
MGETESAPHDVFVGRQPIFDRRLCLHAYELLYRGAGVDFADFREGDQATSRVLLNAFTEFGLERLVGDHLAFVNLTRSFVVGERPLPVPPNRVVLEVLEDIHPDAEVLAGLRDLKRRGFRIALDDFVLREEFEPLLPLADVIKVDVREAAPADVRRIHDELRPTGARMLAEKVETRAQLDVCLDAGFDLFQGHFLARPKIVSGKAIPTARQNLLRLLAELQDEACEFERVQEIVAQDVSLSYKLLRCVNSTAWGLPRRIESIRETVVYLGRDTVKNLASLFLLAGLEDAPHELLVIAMLRARMCELLGRASRAANASPFFTVGLFSTLDALLQQPLDRVLAGLPLPEEVRRAILERQGPMGEALTATLAFERAAWQEVACGGLPAAEIQRAYLDAVAWVETIDRELGRRAA